MVAAARARDLAPRAALELPEVISVRVPASPSQRCRHALPSLALPKRMAVHVHLNGTLLKVGPCIFIFFVNVVPAVTHAPHFVFLS
jgi:hypothetical protein